MAHVPSESLVRLQSMSERLVTQVNALISLHESNRILVYSDRISGQVPRSYAAHTFNIISQASHFYEIARHCALWDKSSNDRESIPSFASLAEGLRTEILRRIESDWRTPPAHHPHLYDDSLREAKAEFLRTLDIAQRLERSRFVTRLRDFRDKHIAHSLSDDADIKRGKVRVSPKYGEERFLLMASIAIVRRFRLAAVGGDYAFASMIEQTKRNAEEFWGGCSLSIRARG